MAIAVAAVSLAALEPAVTDDAGAGPQAGLQHRTGAAMERIVARIAAGWVDRRADSVLFVDPVTGGAGHGYGPAMLAEVLMRDGARRHDGRMLRAGMRALSVNSERAARDGVAGNPLELLAIASAYRWAEQTLADDRRWTRWSRAPRTYLRTWGYSAVGRAAARCFASPSCWNNYKIVDAAAVLMLLETGLRPASPSARLADRERARAAALGTLELDVPRALGRRAEAHGADGALTGLGLLADQPTYPLAYHAMSVAALARALEVLGDRAPPVARESFRRAMLAQASFMAPDGDVAFLGRAQGESWVLAATAYAGEACAGIFASSQPRSARICATLASRAVQRLKRLHGFGGGVLAIVPRFTAVAPTGEGLEHYARVMTFNGLIGMFLGWARRGAATASDVAPMPLPLDRGGYFVDPDRARLVVRRGPVWFAVHAVGPIRVNDLRYDFGITALKFRRGNHWVDVIPQRPLAESGPLDGGGPALVTPYGLAFPRGRRFFVDEHPGEVVVDGGYRTATGYWALRRTHFRFVPSARGVTVVAHAPPGSVLRVQDYLPSAWTRAGDRGRVLSTPTATSRLSQRPILLRPALSFPSANSVALQAFERQLTVPPTGRISWEITARTAPQRAAGA